jgi:hypothetical protein
MRMSHKILVANGGGHDRGHQVVVPLFSVRRSRCWFPLGSAKASQNNARYFESSRSDLVRPKLNSLGLCEMSGKDGVVGHREVSKIHGQLFGKRNGVNVNAGPFLLAKFIGRPCNSSRRKLRQFKAN